MILLSIDPGAERMGWAVLESGPVYVDSGLFSLPRDKEDFQPYKLRVIETYARRAEKLYTRYMPDQIIAEIVPAMGFERSVQNQLAQAAITAMLALAYLRQIPVEQISATTVKKAIGGSGTATKVKVRNGVIERFPNLKSRARDWVKVFDEPDAIAIGLTYMAKS